MPSGTIPLKMIFVSRFQQLAPDGYERNKRNVQHTIKKLQFLVSLIEEAPQRGTSESYLK